MKKFLSMAAMLALCVALSGCIVINVPAVGAGSEAAPAAAALDDLAPAGESALQGEADAVVEDTFEMVPRTIVPATEADQIAGAKVDFVIQDDRFGAQVDEIAEYSEDYIGKNLSMIGEVLHYEEPNPDAQFGLVRWFEALAHEDEVDLDGNALEPHDHDPIPTGFDCSYQGELPADKAWVRAVGTLEEYQYVDEESGETFPALKLNVIHLEAVPDGQGGDRIIPWQQ